MTQRSSLPAAERHLAATPERSGSSLITAAAYLPHAGPGARGRAAMAARLH